MKKFGLLEKIELIFALLYICTGIFVCHFFGESLSLLILSVLMITITVLLIVFAQRHIYWQNKPLLTVLSIYYKSAAYITIIFTMGNFPGKDFVILGTIISMLLYMILSYFNEKRYYQMLNAHLYLNLIILRGFLF